MTLINFKLDREPDAKLQESRYVAASGIQIPGRCVCWRQPRAIHHGQAPQGAVGWQCGCPRSDSGLHLGKDIPITQFQESIVARAIQKRSVSRSGILAKALSVGWGYSDMAYEFSRTRAGCATLLLVDALAAGRSTFYAAQALQELLSLNRCAPEVLPSVDALHSTVKYLVPIMEDSGFRAILENTRLSIEVELRKSFQREEDADSRSAVMRDASHA